MNRTRGRLLALPRRDPVLLVALLLLLVAVAVSLLAPWIAPDDVTTVDYTQSSLAPSSAHWFGTDNYGRDVLDRVVHGGRASLGTAALAVVVILTVGSVVGATAGYVGGWVDLVVTRVIDVLLAFPRLVLAIAIAALTGGGLSGLVIAITAVSWPSYARIVRGYALQIREELHVVAARCDGTPRRTIVRSHLLGSIVGPIGILAMVDVGEVVLSIAGLSFLGLGVRPPAPEWGSMLNEARPFFEESPWMFLAPGLAIFLVVVCANYVGDAVRDALEPRLPRLPERRPLLSRLRGRRARRALTDTRRSALASYAGSVVAELRDVRVSAGDTPILQGVDLTVRGGECVGLVGESGSGKSTLATVLMGLVRAPLTRDAGTVHLLGEDVTDWPARDWRLLRGQHIGLVTQDPLNALNPVLTIGRQLTETVRGGSAKQRSLEALELVRLPRNAFDAYPHQLSGGMRQRVAIAMALVNRPVLLVCDEPTTALDVTTQARVLEELATLRDELGIGMLLVSHDLRVVSQVADRVVVLHEGRVVEEGAAEDVFTHPAHAYTRSLLAALPELSRA